MTGEAGEALRKRDEELGSRKRDRAARLVWTALGWVSLALGLIGLLLPVVPTTPFAILAAFAFGRGSPAMRARLERSRWFGGPIRDWEERGAIRPRHKAMGVSLMAVSIIGALVLGLEPWVIGVQAVCLGGAALFVLTRPSA